MAAGTVAAHAPRIRAFLAEQASRHGVWLLGGLAEPGPAHPRNAAVMYTPDGTEALCYHKIHPFSLAGEPAHYDAGAALPTVTVAGCRVTALICYDLRFPEPFRAAAERTDLFVVIANWPAARRAHWSALLTARAIENQGYVLGVNRVGEGDGLHYAGDSALVDPLGQHIASRSEQPGIILGDVEPALVASARERFSFLADRRPGVYRELANRRATDG
jgi:predicted amidohydrolase